MFNVHASISTAKINCKFIEKFSDSSPCPISREISLELNVERKIAFFFLQRWPKKFHASEYERRTEIYTIQRTLYNI